jgi:hypothetical protein
LEEKQLAGYEKRITSGSWTFEELQQVALLSRIDIMKIET